MNWQSRRVVIGAAWAALNVAAWATRAAAALVVTPKVRLNTSPAYNPQPGDALSVYTANEGNFTGYTAGGYTWTPSGQVNLGTGIIGVTGNVIPTCSGSASPSPNTIYGWWMDDGSNVIVAEQFGTGIFFTFANPGDYLDLQVSIPATLFQNVQ